MYEKKDHYHNLAKKQGYRARSAFKLRQINNKFRVIRKNSIVVDIGASPGGWMQVASEITGPGGKVVGVDIVDMEPLDMPNVFFIRGDITKDSTKDAILESVGYADVIISDIAPKTTGIVDIDRSRSAILSMQALEIAKDVLKPGGNFLTKVFQSQEAEELFHDINRTFAFAKRYRPPSTRKRSVEIYFIGRGMHGEDRQ